MTTMEKITASLKARDVSDCLLVSYNMDDVQSYQAFILCEEAHKSFMQLAAAMGYEAPVLKGEKS